jgi:hypothetical protein
MMRPKRFYLVFSDYGAPTRIAVGKAEYLAMTGQHHGLSFRTQMAAEEFAAWRDYNVRPVSTKG